MNFLAPAAFGLLALLPVIVAMYLLKLKRVEKKVPSVYLWRRMVREIEANAPWQRLRRNLLLLIQLLFLIFLVITLTRPYTYETGLSGQITIMIFDTSASMGATDAKPTRLGAAKNQARGIVNELPDDARVTIISAGSRAEIMTTASRDKGQILSGIDGLKLSMGESDLTTAFQLASAIANRQPGASILLFSDGKAILSEITNLEGSFVYYPIGTSDDNQSISLLSVEPSPDDGMLTIFCQISNYSDSDVKRRIEFFVDGNLFYATDVSLSSKKDTPVLFNDVPSNARIVEARLVGEDVFNFDDVIEMPVRAGENGKVLLITQGNLFLETALSVLPGYEIVRLLPDTKVDYLANENPVLTIIDSTVPISSTISQDSGSNVDLPRGNLLFIAPTFSTPYFSVLGEVSTLKPRIADIDHPVMDNISLDGISILDSKLIQQPDWAHLVVSGDWQSQAGIKETIPLLLLGEIDGRRVGILSFDLRHSDIPLRVAFPLLIANLVNWFSPSQSGMIPNNIQPGDLVQFTTPLDVRSIEITKPDGTITKINSETGHISYSDTTQLGVYRINWEPEGEKIFAVNMFSSQESDIKPAQNILIDGNQAIDKKFVEQQAKKEWWRPLAYIALGLLVLEWLLYHRGTIFSMASNIRMPLLKKS